MILKTAKKLVILVCLLVLGTAAAFGQAVFTAGSSPVQATDIGNAEPIGNITFLIVSGLSVSAPLKIVFTAPITNNDESEIRVTGLGALAGTTLALNREDNSVLVQIPFGGTVGDLVNISGIRVALAGMGFSNVTATVVSPVASGNSIIAGQNNLTVIGEIVQPFTVDQSGAPPLSYTAGTVTTDSTYIEIAENHPNAFVSSTSPTGRLRLVPFPSIPEGLQITYPATSVSETGGVFTTVSGVAETVPREDGSTDVIYQFTEGYDSPTMNEAFLFEISMSGTTTGSGQIQFQAELLPIGLAVPTDQLPPFEIPRYAERLVPDEIDLVGGSTELFVPFNIQRDNTYTGIALTNPMDFRVRATLTAYDADGKIIAGNGITNPAEIELPRNGQYAKLASQIFGTGFNTGSYGTIYVLAKGPSVQGFYLTGDNSGPKLDGGAASAYAKDFWYLPVVFRQGTNPFTKLDIYNPGDSEGTVALRLMDSTGKAVATKSKTISSRGTFSGEIQQIFGTSLNSYQGGYIEGQSESQMIVREDFGNSLESNVLAVNPVSPLESFSIPHFASGGQYVTELTLINTNDVYLAEITLTPLDNEGSQLAAPASLQIQPGAQAIRTVSSLFPNLGNGLVTGSIRVDVKPQRRGPFTIVPALAGSLRFSNVDGSASATLPILLAASNDFIYSHVAQTADWFTGLALLNSGTTAADVTVSVYDREGLPIGSYSSQLGPSKRLSKLLWELVPESEGQQGGYIRITSNGYLTSFALFGSNDLRSLSAIPAQKTY